MCWRNLLSGYRKSIKYPWEYLVDDQIEIKTLVWNEENKMIKFKNLTETESLDYLPIFYFTLRTIFT